MTAFTAPNRTRFGG
jgi:hypothetical protein